MLERAKVSVVIPCYRCADTIKRAVKSVAEQTLKPYEVILVDDCSGDDTLATLYELQAGYPKGWVKVIESPKNGGTGIARNLGWEAATQPYIAFLDSDDSWHKLKIEVQYSWMNKNPNVALTGHACQQLDNEASVNRQDDFTSVAAKFYPVKKNKLLLSNSLSTPSVMVRRDIPNRFPDGKRYAEDYALWLEICCAGLQCYRSDLPLAYLYKATYGESGLSSALWKMEQGELATYVALFKSDNIKAFTLFFLLGFSLAKFLRRIMLSNIKKVT